MRSFNLFWARRLWLSRWIWSYVLQLCSQPKDEHVWLNMRTAIRCSSKQFIPCCCHHAARKDEKALIKYKFITGKQWRLSLFNILLPSPGSSSVLVLIANSVPKSAFAELKSEIWNSIKWHWRKKKKRLFLLEWNIYATDNLIRKALPAWMQKSFAYCQAPVEQCTHSVLAPPLDATIAKIKIYIH